MKLLRQNYIYQTESLWKYKSRESTNFRTPKGCGNVKTMRGEKERETGHTRSRFNICAHEAPDEQGEEQEG